MPDAPPLTPADRAIVEAAAKAGFEAAPACQVKFENAADWTKIGWRRDMRAAFAAALPLAVEVCCIQPVPAAPDLDQQSYGTGYLAALSHVRQKADALAARLAEAGNE